jgi:hypothetical protein
MLRLCEDGSLRSRLSERAKARAAYYDAESVFQQYRNVLEAKAAA